MASKELLFQGEQRVGETVGAVVVDNVVDVCVVPGRCEGFVHGCRAKQRSREVVQLSAGVVFDVFVCEGSGCRVLGRGTRGAGSRLCVKNEPPALLRC